MPVPSFKPNEEGIAANFVSLVQNAYQANSVVFACEMSRMALFSEARFQWRRLYNGKPGDLFGTPDLAILEKPWPKGNTSDLLSRMLLDADLAGTAFLAREADAPDRLRRMRPDWVTMVLGSQDEPDEANIAMDAEFLGVIYHPGGPMSGRGTPKVLLADEVAYFAPIPDPLAAYRGMSWLTPLIREIEADSATTAHKLTFFRNGATPQLVVKMGENVSEAGFKRFVEKMDGQHNGWQNAYKTLYLGAGADVTVVGQNLQQLDFRTTQGAGETRIATASGVHPVLIGLSEGLHGSSLNDGNFRAACRLVADRTLRPLWRNAAGSLQDLVPAPAGTELWYAERDIAFLQENRKDAADIQFVQAQTIRQLVDAQFTADSAVAAVAAEDMTLLAHTGIPTVQGQQGAALQLTNGATAPTPSPVLNGKPVSP
jgi:hypothetical protein